MTDDIRRVLKYELDITDKQTIEMPEGADILAIQEQKDKLVMWAIAYDGMDVESRTFYVVGTGNPMPEPGREDWFTTLAYCATVQTRGGKFVWHVFTEMDFW